jgi:hypothetical protein
MLTNVVDLTVEYIKLILVMCGILNFKFKKTYVPIVFFVITNILLFIIKEPNEFQKVCYIFSSVFMCIFSISGKRKWIFSILCFFVIGFIDGFVVFILSEITSKPYKEVVVKPTLFSLVNAISIILFFLIAIVIKSIAKKKEVAESKDLFSQTNLVYIVLFLIGQIAAYLYISPFIFFEFSDKKTKNIIIFSFFIASIIFSVIGILLIYNNNSKKHYMKVAIINEKLLETQGDYYKMLLEKENETRKFRHDMSNHIICIDALSQEKKYDEMQKYLSSLRDSLVSLKEKYQTGHMMVNAIVNHIASKYEDVNLIWIGFLPDKLQISNMDLCVIFSNILENAFFAAFQCEENKKVKVTVKSISNSLVLTVENNMASRVDEINGKIITKKADKKNHGLGLINIRESVNKNGGAFEYNYTDETFIIDIVLPNVI